MSTITYVFGDARTGTIIEEISLYGVTVSRQMNDGELRGSFNLDQTGKNNADLVAATLPGRSYVVMERDGKVVWGGIVRTRTYQSQSKSCQLYCSTFENYPESRFIRTNFSRTDTEQTDILLALYQQMQADPNGINVDLPSSMGVTLVPRTINVLATDFKNYRQAINSVADGENGFDWRINVTRNGGVYTRTLEFGYPYLGSTNASGLWFEYPGNILNYWENETMGEAGTHIYALGAGEGKSMLFAESIQQSLLDQGFPRYDVDTQHKDITNQGTLSDLAAQEAAIRRAPRPVITAELKGNLDPIFGSYAVGDACTISFRDAKHPQMGGFRHITRILGYEYNPPSDDSVEQARLTFEGEDL